jgi:hypothetical protein
MPFVILPTNSISGGYDITNSLRFNSGSSDYLNRTPASSGNRQIMTFSFWLKRSNLGDGTNYQTIFQIAGYTFCKLHESTNTFTFGDTAFDLETTQVFRDVSAWYHFVLAVDTTQATNTNRVKIYVNGTQVTALTATYPTQNTNLNWNTGSVAHQIGRHVSAGLHLNGYLSEFNFIDGQQLTPSSFGETDFDTGIWKPKAFSGSYGTNGFYLQFKNSASLGTDSSGNGNTFTVNNLTSIDQTTDTPTNNFATLNPLFAGTSSATFAEGNLKYTATGTTQKNTVSTIAVSSGKWFCESKFSVISSGYPGVGIMDSQSSLQTTISYLGSTADSYCIFASGDIYNNGSLTAIGTTFANTDIVGLGLDLDSGTKTLKIYKNGSLVYTQTVSTPANAYVFATSNNLNTSETQFNFGNPIYSSGSFTDGAGFGNFSYAVPSGYYSLNTKNLANFG